MAKEEKKQIDIVRIMGTDISSSANLIFGLSKIKGIGIMFSNAICNVLDLDKNRTIGTLTEKEIEKLETYLSSPQKAGIPKWMLNKRKDYETGEDMHLVAKDIEFDLLQYRRRLSRIKSYKGLRLRAGVPVRGQRTKSNFRRNKTLASMKSKKVGGKK